MSVGEGRSVENMEAVAESYFNRGDMKAAASFYCNLMVLHPKYVKMARVCRVLADPLAVPQPHRYADIVEALLEPSVTPVALFGAGASPTDVNKAFQRWTLLVHPDKNPYPKAGDAFKRLFALRTLALETAGEATEDTRERTSFRDRRGAHGRCGRKSAQHVSFGRKNPSESQIFSTITSEIDMKLSEMKNKQVKLKSLKRKDIGDDELPELREVFRKVRERRFGSRSFSLLDHTASSVPTHILTPDSTFCFDSSVPQSPCNFMPDASFGLTSFPSLRDELLTDAGDLRESSPQLASPSPSAHLSSVRCASELEAKTATEEYSLRQQQQQQQEQQEQKQQQRKHQKQQRKQQEQQQEQQKQQQQQKQEEEAPPEEKKGAMGKAEEEVTMDDLQRLESAAEHSQTAVPVTSFSESESHDDVSFNDAVRGSIKELIQGLQTMTANRARLKLNCDLTFATYEREKMKARAGNPDRDVMP